MDRIPDDGSLLFWLNTLGQAYNTSYGFGSKIIANIKDRNFIKLVDESFNKGYLIKNEQGYNYYESPEIGDSDPLFFDKEFLIEKSKMTISHETIILEYPKFYCFKRKVVGVENKPYIHFNEKRVDILTLEKWDNINIDDILLATSKMTSKENKNLVNVRINNYDKFNKYKIVSHEKCSLVLDPCIQYI